MENMKADAHVIKWKFLWIAWIYDFNEGETSRYYADDTQYITIKSPPGIVYFSIHLSKKRAWNKMKNFAIKKYGGKENGY